MISLLAAAILSQTTGVQLLDEGTLLGPVRRLNCVGSGIVCTLAATGSTMGVLTISGGGGGGAVTDVSVVTANGVSGTVATPTTTPAITLTLGAITPSSVAASGAVTGSNLSGTNTGNQTKTCGAGSGVTTLAAGTSSTCAAFAGGTGTANGTNTGDVTIGTANGLSLAGQAISLATAVAGGANGALLGSDKTKLDALSGTNTGDQTITLTGGVTGSGTGSFAATVITNANLTGPVTSVGNATTIGAGQVSDGNLANNYSGVGTCTNQFARVLNDNAAPTCASVAIADHSATGTPSASTFLRGDNTWATPAGGSGNFLETSQALTEAGVYSFVITGQAWVTGTSKINCTPFGSTSDGLTPEAIAAAALTVSTSDRVVGTGFTLWVDSPRGLTGTIRFHCSGS